MTTPLMPRPGLDATLADLGLTEITDPPPPLGQRRFRCGWVDRYRSVHMAVTIFGEATVEGEDPIDGGYGSVVGYRHAVITVGTRIL